MEIVRLVEEKVLSVVSKVLGVLEGEVSCRSFETVLIEELDGLGCEILKLVIEELDRELKKDNSRKKEWVIERKGDVKTVLTPFGPVTYARTYYPSIKKAKRRKHRGTADCAINIGHKHIYQHKNPAKTPVSEKLVLFRISRCLY